MLTKEKVRDWTGKIIGFIETDNVTGNKVAKDFYGRILGRYIKRYDATQDFYGKLVGRGDATVGLIYKNIK